MSEPVDLSISPHHTPNTITDRMIESLEKTRPWVRLVSVLGFLSSALMGLGAILVLVFATMLPDMDIGVAGAGAIAIIYFVMAVIYFIPSLFLSQYASQISALRAAEDRVPPLESALELQKSFWRYIGIFALVSVLLGLAAAGFAIISAILMSRSAIGL